LRRALDDCGPGSRRARARRAGRQRPRFPGRPLLLVAVQSAAGALGAPALRTFPVRLLGRELVGAGIALQHLSFQAAMLIGPALAGVVLGAVGLTPAYLVQALAHVAALYAVIRLP